jgi:hypothetical protein
LRHVVVGGDPFAGGAVRAGAPALGAAFGAAVVVGRVNVVPRTWAGVVVVGDPGTAPCAGAVSKGFTTPNAEPAAGSTVVVGPTLANSAVRTLRPPPPLVSVPTRPAIRATATAAHKPIMSRRRSMYSWARSKISLLNGGLTRRSQSPVPLDPGHAMEVHLSGRLSLLHVWRDGDALWH